MTDTKSVIKAALFSSLSRGLLNTNRSRNIAPDARRIAKLAMLRHATLGLAAFGRTNLFHQKSYSIFLKHFF